MGYFGDLIAWPEDDLTEAFLSKSADELEFKFATEERRKARKEDTEIEGGEKASPDSLEK